MSDDRKTWVITGVSSGFGRELAVQALAQGHRVVGTMRQDEQVAAFNRLQPGRALGVKLDVTDASAIDALVPRIVKDIGPVDVLVNNAGYGLFGAAEEISDAETRRLMDTNFFGLLHLTRAVLPGMRAHRKGTIVNFSSIAGIMGLPGCGIYCASKFAVEGLSEAMAVELAPLGIKVMVVEPGGFRTNFSGGSKVFAACELEDYRATPAAATRGSISAYHGREPGDPAKAAAAVLGAVCCGAPPLRLVLGADALQMARSKLAALTKNYDEWESVSCGTNVA